MIESTQGIKQISKELKYDRTGFMTPCIITQCDGCQIMDAPGIHVDTSDGEYGPLHVCFECIEKLKKSINPT